MHAASNHTRLASLRAAAAFTLTEMLVAIGVLVVVIVAAAKIFGASSKVASVAEANADLLQTANAIEAQIRADFANLPPNGFLVLQQVEVNQPGQLQTLDPSLGGAEIRADQVAFFTRGIRPTQQYVGSQNLIPSGGVIAADWAAEAAVARVYYGHGVLASTLAQNLGPFSYEGSNAPVVPWRGGRVETVNWTNGAFGSAVNLARTKPSNWPLVRMATLMGTDAAPTAQFAASTGVNATQRLFTRAGSLQVQPGPLTTLAPPTAIVDPLWTSGRVDICKWQMDDLLTQMCYQYNAAFTNSTQLPFTRETDFYSAPSTRLRMLQTLAPWAVRATQAAPGDGSARNTNHFVAYPRVEKAALGPSRAEQMLTAPVLAANCSSFKVEWTWENGLGRSWTGPEGFGPSGAITGAEPIGMYVRPNATQPWFGLDDGTPTSVVRPLSSWPRFTNGGAFAPWGAVGFPLVVGGPTSTVICAVEGPVGSNGVIWQTSDSQDGKRVYQAVFGFNQEDEGVTSISAANRGPYTPLPSALRITVRLHDPLGRIEGGRDFQFIVELPKR
jgi:type II secretory pathway pseudopilin PulG